MKRRLNKRGKILLTSLTIMLSVVIYVLMAVIGTKATEGTIYQLGLICGWIWLFIGQINAYYFIWNSEVRK